MSLAAKEISIATLFIKMFKFLLEMKNKERVSPWTCFSFYRPTGFGAQRRATGQRHAANVAPRTNSKPRTVAT